MARTAFFGSLSEMGGHAATVAGDGFPLDANPLLDIRHTQKINAVVVNGRMLDKKALDDLLAKAEAAGQNK